MKVGVLTDQALTIATLPEAKAWVRSSHAIDKEPGGSYCNISLNKFTTAIPSGLSNIGLTSA